MSLLYPTYAMLSPYVTSNGTSVTCLFPKRSFVSTFTFCFPTFDVVGFSTKPITSPSFTSTKFFASSFSTSVPTTTVCGFAVTSCNDVNLSNPFSVTLKNNSFISLFFPSPTYTSFWYQCKREDSAWYTFTTSPYSNESPFTSLAKAFVFSKPFIATFFFSFPSLSYNVNSKYFSSLK
ncbi:Uncharacterised protein [Streptococcus pneumoniae]|nr:Uncharacterised protein [Streptococcus pneumoniae]CKG03713.1 Uncharacterised protein [Streptococcus pneumoniae]CKG89564.1 Uncharacterised protein [Streptococcus pneumoniae]